MLSNHEHDPSHAAGPDAYRRRLIEGMTFEVIPLKSIDAAIDGLPPGAEVSVTCSPAKDIKATMDLSDRIRALGHTVIPHISARMVESHQHVAEIASWMRTEEIGRMFLVGGDADPPSGPYRDAVSFLSDLLAADPGLHTVGITSYPDSHAFISDQALTDALHAKQAVLAQAGIAGYASTQMCFDPGKIAEWLAAERANGFTLPVHLGIAGVVDRSKLMTMGVRLGIGTSLGFLKKNRRAISKLLTQSDYDPNTLLEPLAADLQPLGVEGLHCFTFNQVSSTEAWRRQEIS